MGVIELVAGVFKPAAELVDELHTSEEERLKAKGHLLDVQAAAMQRVFDYEAESLKAKSSIVAAEAQSEHWVTATWRPITMLTFLALAVGDSMGWLPNPLRDEAWTLLQIGLGGYVVARSGEKIVTAVKKHQ
tara:strand:- start:285 stop:680 length:396 start_codon:yes stop_codon:yes gene_type:complete